MRTVFLVQHLHLLPSGEEDVKIIGIYSSLPAAKTAVTRLKSEPGFCEHPSTVNPLEDDDEQGFHIDEYTIDHDHWTEGFVTIVGDEEYKERSPNKRDAPDGEDAAGDP